MKSLKRFLAMLLAAALLILAGAQAESPEEKAPEAAIPQEEEIPEDEWLAAEQEEAYWALGMWMAGSEGTVKLADRDGNPLELDDEMSFRPETILETEEESLAAVDMDRKRLAIMDETSRAEFDKTDSGDRIGITLLTGSMYFRVGQPLEENESFDVVMDDIRLAIRGTCGIARRGGEGMSILLASGHAVITREPEGGGESGGEPAEEPEEITIEAGESVSVEMEGAGGGFRFVKRKLSEEEVPPFLLKALRKDPEQLEKVYAETGWQPEKLFGDDIPVWMLPAEELDGIPDAWIGRTFGSGGWYRLFEYFSFPEKNKMILGQLNPDSDTFTEHEYPISSVKQYTPNVYEYSYESGRRTERKILILPGITDEEITRLKGCLKLEPMKEQWEMIQGKNRCALLDDDGFLELLYDDITAAGVSQAKPLADFRPCGYTFYCMEIGGGHAEFPDSLIGKTVVLKIRDTGLEETWTFISKNTVKLSVPLSIYRLGGIWHAEDYRELILPVAIDYVSDHFLIITGLPGEDFEALFHLELMIPGMSEQELAFCRECIAIRERIAIIDGGLQPSSAPSDGNRYYAYGHWSYGFTEPEIR